MARRELKLRNSQLRLARLELKYRTSTLRLARRELKSSLSAPALRAAAAACRACGTLLADRRVTAACSAPVRIVASHAAACSAPVRIRRGDRNREPYMSPCTVSDQTLYMLSYYGIPHIQDKYHGRSPLHTLPDIHAILPSLHSHSISVPGRVLYTLYSIHLRNKSPPGVRFSILCQPPEATAALRALLHT